MLWARDRDLAQSLASLRRKFINILNERVFLFRLHKADLIALHRLAHAVGNRLDVDENLFM
jgi:hypothetical protein